MLIIEQTIRTNEGFDVRVKEPGLGRGWTVYAKNMDEAKATLEHYYDHHNHKQDTATCPMCRWCEVNREKYRKREVREDRRGARA